MPACDVRSALPAERASGVYWAQMVVDWYAPVVARLTQLDTLQREGFHWPGSLIPVRWDGVMR